MAKYFCNGNNNNCQPQETSYGDSWTTNVVDKNSTDREKILKKGPRSYNIVEKGKKILTK